jgi:hypothetical protein
MPSVSQLAFLKRLAWQSLIVYALFLIPTVLWVCYGGTTDAALSHSITKTWQAGYWTFPGLGDKGSRILLDVLELFAVGGLAFTFYKGFQGLNAIKSLSLAEERHLVKKMALWLLVVAGLLIFVVPFHSSDLYGYLNRGFQQSLLHTNPYLTTIADIPGWKKVPQLHPHWVDNPCPYGFFFAWLAFQVASYANGSFVLGFILFKAINYLCVLGTAVFVYQLAKSFGVMRPWLVLYLFAANPLVLLHTMGNGHNDILMVFALLGAFWLLTQVPQKRLLSLPYLAISVLTKYASALAGPFVLIWIVRQKEWKALWGGLLLSLFLLFVFGEPYVSSAKSWPWHALMDNAGKPQHSLVDLVASSAFYSLKAFGLPGDGFRDLLLSILKPILWGGFSLFYLGICAWLARLKPAELTLQRIVWASAVVLIVLVSVVSAKFHPWYPIMFLPLAVLLPEESPWRRFALTFSFFQLAGFSIFQNLPIASVLALTVLPAWLTFKNRDLFRPKELTH